MGENSLGHGQSFVSDNRQVKRCLSRAVKAAKSDSSDLKLVTELIMKAFSKDSKIQQNLVLRVEKIVKENQIEAARVALTRHMKRTGKVWSRIFPNIPVSKKPTEVRMGKGKGSPEYWACRVKPGRILFEVDGVTEEVAREALYKASAKLPIKTKFVRR